MSKHSNRGALPAMLVLGVLIGASLAMASPSRPNGAVTSAGPPVVAAPAAPSEDGGARENTQAPQVVNVLINGPGSGEKLGGEQSGTDAAAGGGGSGGTASAGSGGTGGTAGTGSGGSGGSGSGGSGGGGGSGSGSTGADGSGSTAGGKDNNGKANGQFDGKGNNG